MSKTIFHTPISLSYLTASSIILIFLNINRLHWLDWSKHQMSEAAILDQRDAVIRGWSSKHSCWRMAHRCCYRCCPGIIEGALSWNGRTAKDYPWALTYAVERGEFVQIVNIRGNHWCQLNHLNVYDSIPHGDISLREKQQIAALQAKAITLNFPDVQVHVTRPS